MHPEDLNPATFIPARRLVRIDDSAKLPRAAAEEVVNRLNAAVKARGTATLALAGGSTPKALYRLFADDDGLRARMPWAHTHFFFGDERHVSPDHADSNYRMAREALFDRLPAGLLPAAQVHRILTENPSANHAATDYEKELRSYFGDSLPQLDVILLGMGGDGHTASVFPGTTALRENASSVCAVWVDKLSTYRVTMTPPVLCNARCVLFLVAGADKTRTLKAVVEGPSETDRYPSQGIIAHSGETIWMLDPAAAAELA